MLGDALGLPGFAQHPASSDHHFAPAGGRTGEHQRVEQPVGRDAEELALACVDHQRVGARARHQSPSRLTHRDRATGQRAREQSMCGRWLALGRCGRHVARAQLQPGAVVEPAQLFAPIARDMAVRADRQGRARAQPAAQVAQAVAQVGLGAGADHHAGAAARHRFDLCRLAVRGMHQLPALVQQLFACEPGDRPHAGGRDAVVDFGALLGDMQMERPVEVVCQSPQRVDSLRCCSAQRVDGQACVEQRPGAGGDLAGRCPHALRAQCKAPLVLAQRGLAKAGALVEHRHQRQPQARVLRRIGQRPTHGQRVGIGAAIDVVLQVVELADLGVAALQQFEVELGGDRPQLAGRDAQCDRVHPRSPRPEVVALGVALLCQASKSALESMAVGIDQAG